MRYCPQCYSQFADNLSFCLRDGTPLLDEGANSATLVMPAPAKPASSLAKYLLVALLGIGLLAGALALLRWKSAEQPATQASANTPNNTDNLQLKERELELKEKELELRKKELETKNTAPQQTQSAPPAAARPLPPARPTGANGYSGAIGGNAATFYVAWNKNSTVTGSFYFNNSPDTVYTLSGTNFTQGEAEVKAYYGNQVEATIKLYKNIGGGKICWSGSYYGSGGTSPISFCRRR